MTATRKILSRQATAAPGVTIDPTFALIEWHRAAEAAWFKASKGLAEMTEAEGDADAAAMEALLTSEPTTLAGVCALATYASNYVENNSASELAARALAAVADACQTLIPMGDA